MQTPADGIKNELAHTKNAVARAINSRVQRGDTLPAAIYAVIHAAVDAAIDNAADSPGLAANTPPAIQAAVTAAVAAASSHAPAGHDDSDLAAGGCNHICCR